MEPSEHQPALPYSAPSLSQPLAYNGDSSGSSVSPAEAMRWWRIICACLAIWSMAVTCYCAVQLNDQVQSLMGGGTSGSIFDMLDVGLNGIEMLIAATMAVAALVARSGGRLSFMFLSVTALGYVLLCLTRVVFQSPIFYIRGMDGLNYQMLSSICQIVAWQVVCAAFPAAAGLIAFSRVRRASRG